MTWQVVTVGAFTAWLSLGAAIGAWLGPARHGFDPGAFHVQSLYDSRSDRLQTTAAADPTHITVSVER